MQVSYKLLEVTEGIIFSDYYPKIVHHKQLLLLQGEEKHPTFVVCMQDHKDLPPAISTLSPNYKKILFLLT